MSRFIDLTGERFGRLTVLRYAGKNNNERTQWLCKCNCGNEKIVLGYNLKDGHTKSCGCLSIETLTTHGRSESHIYRMWEQMIQRCANPKNKFYHNYGGRGITVCKKWMKFENFLEDMGERPEGYQIDRINNNGNYCKSNCRWATKKQQMRNKRNNRLETYMGKTQCLAVWAEEFQINPITLRSRLRLG